MKKFLIVLLLVTSIFAQSKCEMVYNLAEQIIIDRQIGISPIKMMKLAGKNNAIKNIVIDAYNMPAFSTKKVREKAEKEFATKWYMWCVSVIKK